MIIIMFKFINSSRNKRERNKNIVEMIVIKMMIFKFKKLLVNAKMFLTLMNEMMMRWSKINDV